MLKERASRQINSQYTGHIIKSSNVYLKECGAFSNEATSDRVKGYGMQATDSYGLVMHLNNHLKEMSKKGPVINSQRNELEYNLKAQTLPIEFINLLSNSLEL